ncbi:MAG: universal stress protein [Candidatus Magnetominusculus sp. LBB02]|nr:universal stress protein [Candidatus Magnetominusculus sp. LBB02]
MATTEVSKMDIMYRSQLMGELKSLLLAVDGSEYSEGAIREALLFSKSCSIKLTLLYVNALSDTYESGGMTFVEQVDNKLTRYFEDIRERAAEDNVELDIIIKRSNDTFEGIIEEAYDRKADLIIMGRRGMTGLKRVLMGSVTAKVIAYAPCKVLVVPKDADIKGEHVLLATDGSTYSASAEKEAINMAKRCPHVNYLTVLSVASGDDRLSESEAIVSRVREAAEKEGVNAVAVTSVGSPYEVIVNKAKELNVNVILMGTHGRTGISRLLMGSVAERVVALSHCSVLVIKDREAI